MLDNRICLAISGVATTASTASAFSGEDILAWVIFGINVITLLSNAGIAIYRKWRDRDADKEGDDKNVHR